MKKIKEKNMVSTVKKSPTSDLQLIERRLRRKQEKNYLRKDKVAICIHA